MKCVAQIPHPVAAPAATIQFTLARPERPRARPNRLMAVKLAKKQTNPAMTTSRKSCSLTRQLNTRNMGRSGLRDKDCLEIARNHLFTVNFVVRRFSGRDGTARACGE